MKPPNPLEPVGPTRDRVQHAQRVAALFGICALLAGVYGAGVKSALKAGGLIAQNSESSLARTALHETLGITQPDILAIFSSPDLLASDTGFYEAIEPILDALSQDPAVESTTSYFDSGQVAMISPDESRAVVFVSLRGDDTEKAAALARLRPVFASSSLAVDLGGPLPAEVLAQEMAFRDLARGELFALPVVALLLFLFFRGVTATLLPIAVAGFAVLVTLAILRLATHGMDISVFALNIASIIGIGLSIDYALLVVTRFREEVSLGRSIEGALKRTLQTAGHAILISGLTVAASLTALLMFPLLILRSIGLAGILVVSCAMVGALVLLPALLLLFGRRVVEQGAHRPDHLGRAMHAFAHAVMRRPVLSMLLTTALLLSLGAPVLRMKSVLPDARIFPIGSEVRRVDGMLEAEDDSGFGRDPLTPVVVALRADASFTSAGQMERLIAYTARVSRVSGVDRVSSPFAQGTLSDPDRAREALSHPDTLSPSERDWVDRTLKGDLAVLYVYGIAPWRSGEAAEFVERIRALPAEGLSVQVGGPTAENLDGRSALIAGLPTAVVLILVTNAVVLFLAFGSVVLPIKAVIMNIVSIAASFGALVWVFQDGNLHEWLRFEPPGGIDMTVPVVLLAIIFGLSMDYEIFLLSRIKEEFDQSGDNTSSVAAGLEHTSSIISRAAILMIAVVAAFAFGEQIFVKEIGVGMVIAIAIDVTVVRCALVPATMRLLGNLNWWAPAPLRRLWERTFRGTWSPEKREAGTERA